MRECRVYAVRRRAIERLNECPWLGTDASKYLIYEGNGTNVNPQPGIASPRGLLVATHVDDPYV